MVMVSQFNVYLVSLSSRQGSEIKITRPCLIISPDEMNQNLRTVIVAPMTTTLRNYPSRVKTTFRGKNGEIVLDQIRTIDKGRISRKLGSIHSGTATKVLRLLQEMFS